MKLSQVAEILVLSVRDFLLYAKIFHIFPLVYVLISW